MTVLAETDFLLAIAKDDDWPQERAEEALDERGVVTSPFAYLELLIVLECHQFDYVRLFANLLDIVPVGNEEEQQAVLKAVAYFEDGMTPFAPSTQLPLRHAASPSSRPINRMETLMPSVFRWNRIPTSNDLLCNVERTTAGSITRDRRRSSCRSRRRSSGSRLRPS